MSKSPAMSRERVHFRLIVCPECHHQMCFINPRLPNYCFECGSDIRHKVRECILVEDKNAEIRANFWQQDNKVQVTTVE